GESAAHAFAARLARGAAAGSGARAPGGLLSRVRPAGRRRARDRRTGRRGAASRLGGANALRALRRARSARVRPVAERTPGGGVPARRGGPTPPARARGPVPDDPVVPRVAALAYRDPAAAHDTRRHRARRRLLPQPAAARDGRRRITQLGQPSAVRQAESG